MKELMTADVVTGDLITIAPCDDVTAAAHLMTDHKIGCLPVVDAGKLVGLVAPRSRGAAGAIVYSPMCLRRNSTARGQPFSVARRFAPSRSLCRDKKACPAPSYLSTS